MREFSIQENEKLHKLNALNHEFNLQSSRDLTFYTRQTRFPFDCDNSELFVNFKLGKENCLLDPCLLYIPLKQEDNSYNLEFFNYKGNNNILNEVLVLKFFKFDHLKGFQLKYLSYRMEVNIFRILISIKFFKKIKTGRKRIFAEY